MVVFFHSFNQEFNQTINRGFISHPTLSVIDVEHRGVNCAALQQPANNQEIKNSRQIMSSLNNSSLEAYNVHQKKH